MQTIVLEVQFHMVSLTTSISVLTWAFLLQKLCFNASRTMSFGIIKPTIPPLDSINYQSWKSLMKSYLHSIDLWLLTGETGAAHIDCPAPTAPNAPTADETHLI